jgi:purine catabolism regulator
MPPRGCARAHCELDYPSSCRNWHHEQVDDRRHLSRGAVARAHSDTTPVTVSQLVSAHNWTSEKALLAGAEGTSRSVTEVLALSLLDRIQPDQVSPFSVLVLDAHSLRADNYQVDMAIRVASENGASAIVLCANSRLVSISAIKLADKFKLPLLIEPNRDVLALAEELRAIVKQPSILRSSRVLDLLDRLESRGGAISLEHAFEEIAECVSGPVSLAGLDGSVVIGDPRAVPKDWQSVREVALMVYEGNDVVVTRPLILAPNEPVTYWLVARLNDPSESRKSVASDLLLMASWFVTSRMVQDRLQRERDARFRLGVLSAIIDSADRAETSLKRQLASLGWQVEGWCTGITLQVSGESDPLKILMLTEDLSRRLASVGLNGPLVERPDGWTFWIIKTREPQSNEQVSLSTSLLSAISELNTNAAKIQIHGGIGRSYYGISGLQSSLSEAKEAALIAQAAGGRYGVQHIDALGVRRILLGWYASESFSQFAEALLAPVLSNDPGGELLATLEAYLDSESSSTLTANTLMVHRNTVINRIERLKSYLTVNLDDPEERLAVQLACRVARLKRSPLPGEPHRK